MRFSRVVIASADGICQPSDACRNCWYGPNRIGISRLMHDPAVLLLMLAYAGYGVWVGGFTEKVLQDGNAVTKLGLLAGVCHCWTLAAENLRTSAVYLCWYLWSTQCRPSLEIYTTSAKEKKPASFPTWHHCSH